MNTLDKFLLTIYDFVKENKLKDVTLGDNRVTIKSLVDKQYYLDYIHKNCSEILIQQGVRYVRVRLDIIKDYKITDRTLVIYISNNKLLRELNKIVIELN